MLQGEETKADAPAVRVRSPVHEPEIRPPRWCCCATECRCCRCHRNRQPPQWPSRRWVCRGCPARNRGPVHQPDVDLAAGAVPPQDVGIAVAIEVADALNDPVRGDVADATAARDRRPVHQPEIQLAGAAVPPQNVGFAVAIEVATPAMSTQEKRSRGSRRWSSWCRSSARCTTSPVVLFRHRMSALPSPLKSPDALNDPVQGEVPGLPLLLNVVPSINQRKTSPSRCFATGCRSCSRR